MKFMRLIPLLLLLPVLGLHAYPRDYEEEYDESLHENDNRNIYIEAPMIGNGFAFLYPSRVLSLKMDLSDQFGIFAEPILGHNVMLGFGTTAGFYYRNGKNFNGVKYAILHLDRYGMLHEFFYDYHRYLRTKPGINLRYGFSAGVGMSEFNENRQEEKAKLTYGPTFRIHADLSYLIKYN